MKVYIASVLLASNAAMAMSPSQSLFSVRCGNNNIVTDAIVLKGQGLFYSNRGALIALPLADGQSCIIPPAKMNLMAECNGPENSVVVRSSLGIYQQPRLSSYPRNDINIGAANGSQSSASTSMRISKVPAGIEFAALEGMATQFPVSNFMTVSRTDTVTNCEVHPFTWSDSSGC